MMLNRRTLSGKTHRSDSNTRLLLHFNEADATTSWVDASSYGCTVARNGSAAQTDTDQAKFGSASLLPGADYVNCSHASALTMGTSDFTFECWQRWSTGPSDDVVGIEYGNINSAGIGAFNDTGTVYFRDSGVNIATFAMGLSTGIWYHICMMRASNVAYLFFDGVLKASGACSTNFSATACHLGQLAGVGYDFAGWMDEIRVSKVARYSTGGFTPPTAAFDP